MANSLYIAKQPIFNKNLDTVSYELLYRDSDTNSAKIIDHELATAKILINAFLEIGIDTLTGQKPAFINFPYHFLTRESMQALPPEQIVIEILEDVHIDDTLLANIKILKSMGYKIALDDFQWHEDKISIIELSDIIKLDIQSLQQENSLDSVVSKLKPYPVQLLAEKIEMHEEFAYCCDTLGCQLFQGHFLCKPKLIKKQFATSNASLLMALISELLKTDNDTKSLCDILSRDAALSLKLMRLLNSPIYNLPRQIDSLEEIIVYLGREKILQLATLLLLSSQHEKPNELLLIAATRAKHCELISKKNTRMPEPSTAFTSGLFSMLEPIFDRSIRSLLKSVPLSDSIKKAIISHDGALGELLKSVIAYEEGDWSQVKCNDLTLQDFSKSYYEAVQWSQENQKLMLGEKES